MNRFVPDLIERDRVGPPSQATVLGRWVGVGSILGETPYEYAQPAHAVSVTAATSILPVTITISFPSKAHRRKAYFAGTARLIVWRC